jgi:hypothetical protein
MRADDGKLITGFANAGSTIKINARLQHCDLIESMIYKEHKKNRRGIQKSSYTSIQYGQFRLQRPSER